jgi:hypothetical protein
MSSRANPEYSGERGDPIHIEHHIKEMRLLRRMLRILLAMTVVPINCHLYFLFCIVYQSLPNVGCNNCAPTAFCFPGFLLRVHLNAPTIMPIFQQLPSQFCRWQAFVDILLLRNCNRHGVIFLLFLWVFVRNGFVLDHIHHSYYNTSDSA